MTLVYEPLMQKLIKYIIRAFYAPQHIVFMDILLEHMVLSDEDFCKKMKLLSREFNKIMMKLKEDKLIKTEIKLQSQAEGRDVMRTIYYLNYAEIRDVIKYKIYKMSKHWDSAIKIDDENFTCPTCGKVFSALDAQTLMEDFVFKCVFCHSELVENVVKQDASALDNKKMMQSIEEIVDLLKEVEKFQIPSMDYFQVVDHKKEKSAQKEEKQKIEKKVNIEEKEESESEFEDVITKIPKEIAIEQNEKIYVFVKGVKKEINKITEEDLEMMTEDEYVKYYEICKE
ncbi:hypothetical protein NUSPORA_00778 [Nucleospora cyclopteri]